MDDSEQGPEVTEIEAAESLNFDAEWMSDLPVLGEGDDVVKILYYGDPGSGKTTGAASIAKTGAVIYIDNESGLKRRALEARGIPAANLRPISLKSYEQFEDLGHRILGALDRGDALPVALVWDSLTEAQKAMIEAAVTQRARIQEKNGMVGDPFFVSREDWGKNTEQLRRTIRMFRDLPIHVAVCALVRRDEQSDGITRIGPAITPALQQDVMGFFDLVCRTFTATMNGRKYYFGSFEDDGVYFGKDRFGIMPPRLVDPTFDRIVAYVNGDLTIDTDPVMTEAMTVAEQVRAEKAQQQISKSNKSK
jgi:hypothetical protein